MKEERIYVSENKLEYFVTRLWTNKVRFSYVVYYESFKSGKGMCISRLQKLENKHYKGCKRNFLID